jgi:hypothetical protein
VLEAVLLKGSLKIQQVCLNLVDDRSGEKVFEFDHRLVKTFMSQVDLQGEQEDKKQFLLKAFKTRHGSDFVPDESVQELNQSAQDTTGENLGNLLKALSIELKDTAIIGYLSDDHVDVIKKDYLLGFKVIMDQRLRNATNKDGQNVFSVAARHESIEIWNDCKRFGFSNVIKPTAEEQEVKVIDLKIRFGGDYYQRGNQKIQGWLSYAHEAVNMKRDGFIYRKDTGARHNNYRSHF